MGGFTLPELIAVLVIAGIVAAVGLPKLWGQGYDESAFAQETAGALRYAQKSALAMQRTVCATFTATSLTLRYLSTYGDTTCLASSPGLIPPGGGPAPYVVTAQHGGTFTSSASYNPVPASFYFDRTGAPSAGQTITFNDGSALVVESGSGYVH